jgi:TolA-binding protein
MKSTERHKLKENEFARSVARARGMMETRGRDVAIGAGVVALVIVFAAGYMWWRQAREAKASGALASALAVYESPVVPVGTPAPGSPMPVAQPGTFQTEQAKLDAALPKFTAAADQFANTDAGVAARYHAAGILSALGRYPEAEQRYQEVVDKAGRSIYGRTARLGLADVQVAQGKFDPAIKLYQELATDANSQLPIDGVLMQLGRAYAKAGKRDDAARAFNRVVEEFPQSLYTADAKRELEDVKKGQEAASLEAASRQCAGAPPITSTRRTAPQGTNTTSPAVRIADSPSIVTLISPRATAWIRSRGSACGETMAPAV